MLSFCCQWLICKDELSMNMKTGLWKKRKSKAERNRRHKTLRQTCRAQTWENLKLERMSKRERKRDRERGRESEREREMRERGAFVYAVQGLCWNSIPVQILFQAATSHWVQCRDAEWGMAIILQQPTSTRNHPLKVSATPSTAGITNSLPASPIPTNALLYSHKHW